MLSLKPFHKEVVFGKRLTAQDLMNVDSHPQARINTNYQGLIRRQMITKFGTLTTPVVLDALLSLDSIDRDELESAADRFLEKTREDRTGEFRKNNIVKLMFGFHISETNYDVVEFGNRYNGYDEAEADMASLRGVSRDCFLIGKQISKISSKDDNFSISGKVDLETFFTLDAEDFQLLKVGAELFRQSFRFKRESVQTERNGDSDINTGAGNEAVGSGNNGDAAGTH